MILHSKTWNLRFQMSFLATFRWKEKNFVYVCEVTDIFVYNLTVNVSHTVFLWLKSSKNKKLFFLSSLLIYSFHLIVNKLASLVFTPNMLCHFLFLLIFLLKKCRKKLIFLTKTDEVSYLSFDSQFWAVIVQNSSFNLNGYSLP